MDQYNDTLLEAVQEPNVSGALQQLLMAKGAASPQASNPAALQQVMMQRMLGRQNTPEQSAQLQENRASALKQYQEALMQPSSGPMTASEVGAYNWIGNMGKMSPFAALTSGVAAGGQALMDSFAGERNGNVAAARVGYDDAAQLDVLDSRELPYLKAGATAKVSVGGTGGAEKILPLYGKIFNSYSQQAKDMQFATPAERTAWIRQNTDETVKATVGQFGISVNPEVLGKLFSATASVDSENADATSTSRIVQSNGSPSAKQTASSEISSASPPGMQIAPGTQKARDSEASRLRNGEMDGSLPGWPTMPAGPSAASSVDRGKFAQSTPPGTPPFRNVPNEKLMAKGAEGMGEAYTKDYTAMQDSAAAARDLQSKRPDGILRRQDGERRRPEAVPRQPEQLPVARDQHVGPAAGGQFEELLVVRVPAARQRVVRAVVHLGRGLIAHLQNGAAGGDQVVTSRRRQSEFRVRGDALQFREARGVAEAMDAAGVDGRLQADRPAVVEMQHVHEDVGVEHRTDGYRGIGKGHMRKRLSREG